MSCLAPFAHKHSHSQCWAPDAIGSDEFAFAATFGNVPVLFLLLHKVFRRIGAQGLGPQLQERDGESQHKSPLLPEALAQVKLRSVLLMEDVTNVLLSLNSGAVFLTGQCNPKRGWLAPFKPLCTYLAVALCGLLEGSYEDEFWYLFRRVGDMFLNEHGIFADVNAPNRLTLATFAAQFASPSTLRRLVEHRIVILSEHPTTYLKAAVASNKKRLLSILLEAALNDVFLEQDKREDALFCALQFAAGNGYAKTMRVLLKHGAPLIAPPDRLDELHPVHLVCQLEADDAECLKLLCRHGVDLNITDRHGETPLHHAVKSNSVSVVRYLLSKTRPLFVNADCPPDKDLHCCDPLIPNMRGITPLMAAERRLRHHCELDWRRPNTDDAEVDLRYETLALIVDLLREYEMNVERTRDGLAPI